VITGKAIPQKVHLAELFADQEIMEWITKDIFGKDWTVLPSEKGQIAQTKKHYLCEIEYWYRMGYDYIRVTGGIDFATTFYTSAETAEQMGRNKRQWANMNNGPIQNRADFEAYPWPKVRDEDLWIYEFVAKNLPEGMGILACPHSGFFEIPAEFLLGYESMALMSFDEPDLVKDVFDKVRSSMLDVYEKLVDIPRIAGFFQGDDMGFKTGTLMSPDFLRKHVLPGHKAAAELAHSRNKIYLLHSCGNLDAIMEDLIDDVGIDAKQSFEDTIIRVEDFYHRYSDKIAVLGGLDINLLAGADEEAVRRRSREILSVCVPKGKYAFGSGNTITNYSKKQNVLAMFDEAYSWRE